MADWLTHVLLGLALVEFVSLKYPKVRKYRFIVLIGAVLPDLGNITMFMGETGTYLSYSFIPLHSPIGILLLIIPLSFIARKGYQKNVFLLLILGAGLHLVIDFFIVTLSGKLPLLFPFSFEGFGYGGFLQGGWSFVIFGGVVVLVSFLIRLSFSNVDDVKK